MAETILDIQNLSKSFDLADNKKVQVLKGLNFKIEKADFLMIFGPSGCGKSTLLHTLLGLEKPDTGTVKMFGKDLYKNFDRDDRAALRNQKIGMIYQQPNWIKSQDVVGNVAFPLILAGETKKEAVRKAGRILESLKMTEWNHYHPNELSSGQQQKIALARAVINNPSLIIADEPTGNLDFKSGQMVMKFLADLNKEYQKTIVMVTHDFDYLKYATKIVNLFNGELKGVHQGAKMKGFLEQILKEKKAEI